MDKYRKTAEKRLGNDKSYGNHKIHPEELARQAHVKGHFDLFLEWLKTEPHETKSREFLYNSAMALGSVKEKMMNFEMYGKNVPHLQEDNNESN